jgi:hypothetical protein
MPDTVFVMCKAPAGLILELAAGTAEARKFRVAGPNTPNAEVINGAGVTQIPADFWNAWREEFKEFEPLKRGALWAAGSKVDAAAQARELKDVNTGFEGIDPENPGKGIDSDGAKVEPTEEQKTENAKLSKGK